MSPIHGSPRTRKSMTRRHHRLPKTKMPQYTTQKKQMMRSLGTRPDKEGVVSHGDDATADDRLSLEGEEEILGDDSQGDHSTVSTEGSRAKGDSYLGTSPYLKAETDPTSLPSGTLDDLDRDRKCTDSPPNSLEAVAGSDSIHYEESASSTGDSDSTESMETAVKVQGIGDQFGESYMEPTAQRFHDPTDSGEAEHIKNKIKQANDTLDDIALHPKARFRDHGTSFQVSAQPEESAESAPDGEYDIAHKRNVHSQPAPLLHSVKEERLIIQGPRKRSSSGCINGCVIL